MNAMVVYTEKAYAEKFSTLVWILWNLSIAFCCFDFVYLWIHVHKDRTREKLRQERKHEKLRRRFKQIHRKLKELEDNYKMQYEHFTQLIDHVRTDLLDHITV